jgi:hypothetical protein
MNLGMVLLGLILACSRATSQSSDEIRRFRVDVPPGVDTRQTHLLLHEVRTPRNRPLVLRAYALAPDSSRVYLGSTGLPAISAQAKGETKVALLRINITTGFRRWLTQVTRARKVDLEIRGKEPADSANASVPWSVRTVELVHPD